MYVFLYIQSRVRVKNKEIAQYSSSINEKDRELNRLQLTLQQAQTDKVSIYSSLVNHLKVFWVLLHMYTLRMYCMYVCTVMKPVLVATSLPLCQLDSLRGVNACVIFITILQYTHSRSTTVNASLFIL